MIVSSDRTTRQVDHVPHADPVGDFPQLRAAGREEAAHQAIAAELFHPVLPALGAKTQPLEDPASSSEIEAFPWRMRRPIYSTSSRDSPEFLEAVLEPLLRLPSPSPSKNALRTQRDTQ